MNGIRGTKLATRILEVSLDSSLNSLHNEYHEGPFPSIEFEFSGTLVLEFTVLQILDRGQEISEIARPLTVLSVLPRADLKYHD